MVKKKQLKGRKSSGRMASKGFPNPIDVHVGHRIRLRRTLLGMSQGKLANAIGLTFQQIQKYEKGVNRLSSGRLVELAATLQCSAADLIGGVEKASAKSTPFSRYAASKEGVAIINAMAKISSPALRRHVINLAETLASR